MEGEGGGAKEIYIPVVLPGYYPASWAGFPASEYGLDVSQPTS